MGASWNLLRYELKSDGRFSGRGEDNKQGKRFEVYLRMTLDASGGQRWWWVFAEGGALGTVNNGNR